ncbi:MAG: serine hydrolase [Actinobacteria bacterium]|nr:serine hydrolase [Actinomycetota bacterium]
MGSPSRPRRVGRSTLEQRLAELFGAAGCDAFLHVLDVDAGGEVAFDADAIVVSASVFKVSVALEFFRQVAAGELDATERVRVDPQKSLGAPAGLSLFRDEVEVSLRDLAASMLTVSDALATDVLLQRVTVERVNELTRSLGLAQTVVVDDILSMFDSLARECGFAGWAEFANHPWNEIDEAGIAHALELMRAARTCDPARANRTTPRETTGLLRAIWRDEAAPPEACAAVRALMAKQLQRQRIARGFSDSNVRFSGKTGTFGGTYRNEAGVVEFPDGGRYAVAIFTRAHALYERQREIDDAIGTAAGLAVHELRASPLAGEDAPAQG